MKIIHGRVTKEGGIAPGGAGSGDWKVENRSAEQVENPERHTILFDVTFDAPPTVTATAMTDDVHTAIVWNPTRKSVQIAGFNHATNKSELVAVGFIAVGTAS